MVKTFFKKRKTNLKAGFSLLEMVMVLAIFGIITSIVAFNYGKFNNQITLTNLSYEIAMQIREAQALGFGVRGNNNNFEGSFGVNFVKGLNTFTTFVDSVPLVGTANGICSDCTTCVSGSIECQKIISLPRQMTVWDIRTGATESTVNTTTGLLNISFKRPNPDAIIKDSAGIDKNIAQIIIKSQDNQYRKITVKKSGYVSVSNYVP